MTIFILLVLFQIKHFLADYPLQTPYMLRKFLPGKGFVLPLLAHSGVHALMTFSISTWFVSIQTALSVALLDLVLHFVMDRIKASPTLLGRFKSLSAKEYMMLKSQQSELESVGAPRWEIQAIDRKFKENTYFWWALGLDQAVHHLTHYLIIAIIVTTPYTPVKEYLHTPRFRSGDCLESFHQGYYRNIIGVEGLNYKVITSARSKNPSVEYLDVYSVDLNSEIVECQ